MWQQSGGSLDGYINAAFFLDPTIPTRPVVQPSAAYPGFGAFLRNGVGQPDETYVAVRFGDLLAAGKAACAGAALESDPPASK